MTGAPRAMGENESGPRWSFDGEAPRMMFGQAGDLVAGRYRLDWFAGGSGGGGQWRAYDERLARAVTLRISPAPAAGGGIPPQSALNRIARLNHPGVAAVYDAGVTDQFGGVPVGYAVSEWTEGRTLGQIMTTGPQTWRRAVDWGRQISGGLSALHQIGVAHGALGPDCVVVHDDRQVKILDAGLAFDDGPGAPAATVPAQGEPPAPAAPADAGSAPTAVLESADEHGSEPPAQPRPEPEPESGTPAAAQPQAPEPADPRAAPEGAADDVYALGSLLWEAVVSTPPLLVPGGGPDLAPLRATGVPDEFADLLADLLAEDPGERPTAAAAESCFARLAALDRAAGVRESASRTAFMPLPQSPPAPHGTAPVRAKRRRTGVFAGIAGLLAATGVIAGLLLANSAGDSSANTPGPDTTSTGGAATPGSVDLPPGMTTPTGTRSAGSRQTYGRTGAVSGSPTASLTASASAAPTSSSSQSPSPAPSTSAPSPSPSTSSSTPSGTGSP